MSTQQQTKAQEVGEFEERLQGLVRESPMALGSFDAESRRDRTAARRTRVIVKNPSTGSSRFSILTLLTMGVLGVGGFLVWRNHARLLELARSIGEIKHVPAGRDREGRLLVSKVEEARATGEGFAERNDDSIERFRAV